MSGKFRVTAKLKTVVAVRYTDQGLTHGKWQTDPGGTAGVGTSQIFVATNRDSSSVGPKGWVSYIAADGTTFTFSFSDPGHEQNSCSSSMDHVSGPWSLPVPDYPRTSKKWTVTYQISSTAEFFDAPVFPEDLLEAEKCAEYDRARVSAWIGDRSCVRLRDVLEHGAVPIAGKIWCATHTLFLTPSSKGVLTRDLAEVAIRELGESGGVSRKLLDEALQANRDVAAGLIGPAPLADLRRRLRECADTLHDRSPRNAALVDVISALAEPDPDTGWRHAVFSYLADAEGEQWAEYANRVLRVVESRL